jgi:DNA primase
MSTIDEVKQKLDITEVVGSYVTLKKAGRNLTACCPFHSEKTPSFFVFPEKQSWHCFGACNTGGDIFAFVMKKESVEFGEALRLLAQRAGVVLPARPEPGIPKEEKEEYFNANEAAALYYHNLLLHNPAAAKAKAYIEKRGLNAKTIADFQLGYALDSWDALKSYLMEKGHTEKTLVTAGLLYQDDKGKSHDRFRHKLMIPIKDARGRVTGFGSRVLDDSQPKYINSPQSPTFDKSGTLFGIDRAAAEIRTRNFSIIMEGYMDVIMAHQFGVSNAVASMGTSITETQINILKKLSKNLVLCLDADAAGEEAMLRAVGYENALGSEMKVIRLPEGKDPDEVMLADFKEWQKAVDTAAPLIDFMFEKKAANLDLGTALGKSGAVSALLPVLAAIIDPIRQAHYLQKLAALVRVDMNTIQMSLNQLKHPTKKYRVTADKAGIKNTRPLVSYAREEYLLTLLLQNPEYKTMEEDISIYIENSVNREIIRYWQEAADLADLKERLDPAIHEHMDAILGKKLPPGLRNDIEHRILDCISELKRTHLKNMAARRSESGDVDAGTLGTEEDVAISQRLRDLDITRAKKQNASFGRRR